MQTIVEIGPSNALEGQHRSKEATEQMKNLTLARTRTQVPGFSSADALATKLRVYIYIFTIVFLYISMPLLESMLLTTH